MLRFDQVKECIICKSKYKVMISLQQCLDECDGLSVIAVLKKMHFVNISTAGVPCRVLCCSCVAKVLSCYEFKAKCGLIDDALGASPIVNNIKLENDHENPAEDYREKNNAEISSKTAPTLDTSLQIKSEIDINVENSASQKESNQEAEKPYVCDVCNKSFFLLSYLTKHKIMHIDDKPYICDVCNKSFKRKGHLVSHKLIHSGEKPYICDVCNKGFNQSSSLNTHKMYHYGNKPYVCEFCNKAYTTRGNLHSHRLVHVGAKPYVCNICKKSFIRSNDLKRHCLIHTGEKCYVCDVCYKSFNHPSNLSKHKQLHINVRLE